MRPCSCAISKPSPTSRQLEWCCKRRASGIGLQSFVVYLDDAVFAPPSLPASQKMVLVQAVMVRIVKPTFFAQLTTKSQDGKQVFDCRPSDALT